ncbi:unnamed protein product [Psylliodes chrysocephalus]|uniref:BED-type domain-containing protein n=1 Tax=Psylliodes chrysocephalus TaxID=3402493 RepID=A0A9P0DEL1_9CUCU|nr:unnamed protein product [Psylliodes chrysocephala]
MSRKESAKKSEILNFFEIKPKADKIAVCNICKTDLSYKSSSNNLRKHMQRKHPLVKLSSSENESRSMISPTSEADFNVDLPSTSGTASTSSSDKPECIKSKPAQIQPTVKAKYEEVYNKTKEELKGVGSVTLTTDCWTSSSTESFLAVTAHLIDNNFELKHRVLGCDSFSERHTSANLASAIRNILAEWDLENKVLIFISDNAANIKKP